MGKFQEKMGVTGDGAFGEKNLFLLIPSCRSGNLLLSHLPSLFYWRLRVNSTRVKLFEVKYPETL